MEEPSASTTVPTHTTYNHPLEENFEPESDIDEDPAPIHPDYSNVQYHWLSPVDILLCHEKFRKIEEVILQLKGLC